MTDTSFQWAVIGAGPAGIAAVGKLLDNNVAPQAILWLDPYFKVGDFGQYWSNVTSNTCVARFIDFLHAVDVFKQVPLLKECALFNLPSQSTCKLSYMAEPLEHITYWLKDKVVSVQTFIKTLELCNNHWKLCNQTQCYQAQNVILATGASPRPLTPATHAMVMPFANAIDKPTLLAQLKPNHTYGVIGASHSAIMITRHLVEAGVNVINFYRHFCRYALDMGEWILFDNTGLKGETADWARAYIDGVWPKNLMRCASDAADVNDYLKRCDTLIYAIGFTPRTLPVIKHYTHAAYNPHLGIIGPGLFGLGIGFPERKADPFGHIEDQVGLWKFMTYLQKVLPIWLRYTNKIANSI